VPDSFDASLFSVSSTGFMTPEITLTKLTVDSNYVLGENVSLFSFSGVKLKVL
jgi:hypothetical protein